MYCHFKPEIRSKLFCIVYKRKDKNVLTKIWAFFSKKRGEKLNISVPFFLLIFSLLSPAEKNGMEQKNNQWIATWIWNQDQGYDFEKGYKLAVFWNPGWQPIICLRNYHRVWALRLNTKPRAISPQTEVWGLTQPNTRGDCSYYNPLCCLIISRHCFLHWNVMKQHYHLLLSNQNMVETERVGLRAGLDLTQPS